MAQRFSLSFSISVAVALKVFADRKFKCCSFRPVTSGAFMNRRKMASSSAGKILLPLLGGLKIDDNIMLEIIDVNPSAICLPESSAGRPEIVLGGAKENLWGGGGVTR